MTTQKIKAGILGATSYTGCELIELLLRHRHIEIAFVTSKSYAGDAIEDIFPKLKGRISQKLLSFEDSAGLSCDVLFSCLPHAISATHCLPWIESGVPVIDLSADFRLTDSELYAQWYATQHPAPQLLPQAVYGLSDWQPDKIKGKKIIANPGCYPTSILLPLLPIATACGHELSGIIADSKSGVSGAGRALKLATHFVEANENFSPYNIGHKHRHTVEIEQQLRLATGNEALSIVFSPHLVPMSRGILSTIYFQAPLSAQQCTELARQAYKDAPFVIVEPTAHLPNITAIRGTNKCHFSFSESFPGGPVIAVSVEDNLLKGASGQAVQNANIIFDFPVTEGLC